MRPDFDFDERATEKSGDLHGAPRRFVIAERFGIQRVDGGEISQVDQNTSAFATSRSVSLQSASTAAMFAST